MAVSEMDGVFIRAFRYLHSNASDSLSNLEALLEDAIQSRYGPDVDLHSILNIVPPMGQENHINSLSNSSNNESLTATLEVMDECRTGSSSDNELELDLLKEDLMCIICKGMSQGARNRLLECAGCHCLYHQECHDPSVSQEEFENSPIWMCDTCTKIQQLEDAKNSTNMSPEKGEMISTSIAGSTTGSPTSQSPNSSSESPEKGNSNN